MNIEESKIVLLKTHVSALALGYRPSGYMLQSAPGIGKTESRFQGVEMLCRYVNQPVGLVQFMLATITSADVRGFGIPLRPEAGTGVAGFAFTQPPWFPVKSNTWVCEPPASGGEPDAKCIWHRPGTWTGPIPEIGELFLDEWGQAEDDVKKPAAELLLNGNVGSWELLRGWRVTAATNRTSDRSGVLRELMFTVSRRGLIAVEPHAPTWLSWAERQSDVTRPHFMTISFARKHPGVVFRETVPEGTDPFCNPRTTVRMDRDVRALRTPEEQAADRMPMDPISREVCVGWIGEASAGQYFTHLKFAEELPEMEDVEADPMRAKLPLGKDAQTVLAYMLAHHLNDGNAQPIMTYLGRMIVEQQVIAMLVIGADLRRQKAVVILPEYQNWLMQHKDVLAASRS